MGGGSWTSNDWDDFKTTATVNPSTGQSYTRAQIFSRGGINPQFDPAQIQLRESVDSPDNPESTPIIVALDVTGSMGIIPEALIKDGLGKMATEIITRKPVSDPHIMFMAVGDAHSDRAPLQATQFEADIRIAEQLKELYLEGNGGGNNGESYYLPWYFAARKTAIDSFDKRGQKGLLFTIGDEPIHGKLLKHHAENIFGDTLEDDIATADLLKMVEERYDVFHLIIEQGDYCSSKHGLDRVRSEWKELLGERAIPVSDYTKVPEIIVSTLEVMAGKPKQDIAASWDGTTALVVQNAIKDLTTTKGGAVAKPGAGGGVWRPGGGAVKSAPVYVPEFA